MKSSSFIDNKYISSIFSIILALYSVYIAPKLPNYILNFFDTPFGRLLFMFLIAYLASDGNTQISIMVSIFLTICLLVLDERKMKESFINEHFKSNDIDEVVDTDTDTVNDVDDIDNNEDDSDDTDSIEDNDNSEMESNNLLDKMNSENEDSDSESDADIENNDIGNNDIENNDDDDIENNDIENDNDDDDDDVMENFTAYPFKNGNL